MFGNVFQRYILVLEISCVFGMCVFVFFKKVDNGTLLEGV